MTEHEQRTLAERLQETVGYSFSNPDLLKTALTHRSSAYEEGTDPAASYERLEFLGDALLGWLVSDWLYRDDDQAPEGALSRRRQSVVRTSSLAAAAERLGLGEAMHLGRGEDRSGGRSKPSLLADTFEALLAAIYLDGGVRAARSFVHRALGPVLRETRGSLWTSDDYKTRLQEAMQAELRLTPRYRIVSRTGPDHALEFESEVVVGDRVLGRGSGPSRKRAEQAAARQALETLPDGDTS